MLSLLLPTAVLYVWRLARRGREGWAAALVGLSLAGLVFLPPDYVARVSTITDLDADPTGSSRQPFKVSDQNMTDTVAVMVEYGGLDAAAKDNSRQFYTNEYLPPDMPL